MPDAPVGGALDQHQFRAGDGDRVLALGAFAADGQDHVRRVAVHAVDERQRHARVDAADQRGQQQALAVAVAAVEEGLDRRAQAAALKVQMHSMPGQRRPNTQRLS